MWLVRLWWTIRICTRPPRCSYPKAVAPVVPELNGKQNPRRNDCPSSSPHTAGVSKVPHGRVPSRGFCGQRRDVPRASVPAAPCPLTALLPLSLPQREGWSENFQESSPPLFLSYMSSILSFWERKNSPDSFHLGAGVAPRAGPWPLRTTLWHSPPKYTQLCRPHHQRQTLCDHGPRRRDTPGWRSRSPDGSRCLRAAHVTGHSRPPAHCGWSCSHRSQLCLLSLAPFSAKEKLLRSPPTPSSWKHPAQRKPLLPQRLQKYSKQAFLLYRVIISQVCSWWPLAKHSAYSLYFMNFNLSS